MSGLSLSNVRSEGALLPVDVLQRIVSRDRELPGMYPKLTQGDSSESLERERNPWHLSGGERLTDAINRSWQKMLAVWRRFAELRDNLPEGDPGTRLTREELLLPLFAELGYGRLVAAIQKIAWCAVLAWHQAVGKNPIPFPISGCIPPSTLWVAAWIWTGGHGALRGLPKAARIRWCRSF